MDTFLPDILRTRLVTLLDIREFLQFAATSRRSMCICIESAEQRNVWAGGYNTMYHLTFKCHSTHNDKLCAQISDDNHAASEQIRFLRRIKDAFACYCGAADWSIVKHCKCHSWCVSHHDLKDVQSPVALLVQREVTYCAAPRIHGLCAHYYLLTCYECNCDLLDLKSVYVASKALRDGKRRIKWMACSDCGSKAYWLGMNNVVKPRIYEVLPSGDLLRIKIYITSNAGTK